MDRVRSRLKVSESKDTRNATVTMPLSPSGSVDPGDLIQTDAIRQLKFPGNSISFILGRKGTGKTRLLRELAEAKLGEPLVTGPNSPLSAGIKAPRPGLTKTGSILPRKPPDLWCRLLPDARH